MSAGPPYEQSVLKWRAEREHRLKAEDGWLTLAGLFWLKEGSNSIGSDPQSDIMLPRPAPARAGTVLLHAGRVMVKAGPAAHLTLNGHPIASAELRPDDPGPADVVRNGPVSFLVIKRGSRYGVRVKDNNAATRLHFRGLRWFPVQQKYRIVARWVSEPRKIPILNVLGQTELSPSPGYAVFKLGGRELRLEPIQENPNELFFIFRDLTAGKQTYPAGRFLYTDLPKSGEIVLDFNKAENPPCAFTPYATCPLPPTQNRLAVPIPAGEMRYPGGD